MANQGEKLRLENTRPSGQKCPKHATYGNIRFPKWECENIDFSMISPIGRI